MRCSGAVFLAIVVVVVLIVVNSSSSDSGGDTENLEGAAEVDQLLARHPAARNGPRRPERRSNWSSSATCSARSARATRKKSCRRLSKTRSRTAKRRSTSATSRSSATQSVPAGAAALAAGEQGRGWNFVELFYRTRAPRTPATPTTNSSKPWPKAPASRTWRNGTEDRRRNCTAEVEATTEEAQNLGFNGTPSFAIKGPGTEGLEATRHAQTPRGTSKRRSKKPARPVPGFSCPSLHNHHYRALDLNRRPGPKETMRALPWTSGLTIGGAFGSSGARRRPARSPRRSIVASVSRLQWQPSPRKRQGFSRRSCHLARSGSVRADVLEEEQLAAGFRTRLISRSAAAWSGTVQRTSVTDDGVEAVVLERQVFGAGASTTSRRRFAARRPARAAA